MKIVHLNTNISSDLLYNDLPVSDLLPPRRLAGWLCKTYEQSKQITTHDIGTNNVNIHK